MRKVPDCGPNSAAGGGILVAVVAEQVVDEIAAAARRSRVLRTAIVLRQRRQHRAALVFTVGAADAAAAQALEAGGDLVEIAAHLLDLVVDRSALRRLAVEQREEARAFAAHPLGLHCDAIEFGLLLGGGLLVAPDLFVLGGIAASGAAVHGRQLAFKPDADRIGLRRTRLRRGLLRRRGALAHLRQRRRARGREAEQHGASQDPAGKGSVRYFKHIRPSRGSARLGSLGARPWRHGAAKAASHTCFSGQRHVVSGARVWQSAP